MNNKIIYLLSLLLSFWFAVMYGSKVYTVVIFLTLLTMPFIHLIMLIYIRSQLDISAWKEIDQEAVKIKIKLRNKAFIPLRKIDLYLNIKDNNSGEIKIIPVSNIKSRSEKIFNLEFEPGYSGVLLLEIEKIYLYDYIGMFKKKSFFDLEKEIYIYPESRIFKVNRISEIYKENTFSDAYSKYKNGSDKSEISEIREYVPGDNVKDIHWKLSAKSDRVFVKNFVQPVSNQVQIWIDPYIDNSNNFMDTREKLLKSLFSLMDTFEENATKYIIRILDTKSDEFINIDKIELLKWRFIEGKRDIYEIYNEKKQEDYNIFITSADVEHFNFVLNENTEVIDVDHSVTVKVPCEKDIVKKNSIKDLKINTPITVVENMDIIKSIFTIFIVLLGTGTSLNVLKDLMFVEYGNLFTGFGFCIGIICALILVLVKNKGVGLAIVGAIVGFYIFLFYNETYQGINFFIEMVKIRYARTSDQIYVSEISNTLIYTAIDTLSLIYIVILTIFSKRRIVSMVHLLITAPPVILYFSLGMIPDGICLIMYAMYLVMICIFSISYNNIVRKEKNKIKTASYGETYLISIKSSIIGGAVFLLISVSLVVIMSRGGYSRNSILDDLKEKMETIYNDFIEMGWGEKKTNKFDGKMGLYDEVDFKYYDMYNLKVSGITDKRIYLRSFIGDEFTGDEWLNKNNVLENSVKKQLESNAIVYNDLEMYQYYMCALEDKLGIVFTTEETEHGKIEIQTLFGDSSSELVPYYSKETDDDGNGNKTYDVYGVNNPEEVLGLVVDKFKIVEHTRNEASLEDISYLLGFEYLEREIALELDLGTYDDLNIGYISAKEDYKKLEKEIMNSDYIYGGKSYDLAKGWKENGYSVYIDSVKKYLSSNCTYSLQPGKTEPGKEFITDFLFEKKEGYCTYFASAATIMFRMYGIPARFVEGFCGENDGSDEIILKDSDAHAWVEIYVDGFGWMPVEVTPGFSGSNGYKEVTKTTELESETKTTEKKEETTTNNEETTIKESNIEENNNSTQESILTDNNSINGKIFIVMLIALCGGGVLPVRRKLIVHWVSKRSMIHIFYRDLKILGVKNEYFKNNIRKAEDISEKTGFKNKEEIEKLLFIFDKGYYSEEGSTNDEKIILGELSRKIINYQYNQKNMVQKLFLKYIKCLYLAK